MIPTIASIMDPVIPISLALGVAPLIISALENYERTFQPLVIFSRDCQREVERFHLALSVQKTAFANSCHLLLSLVTAHREDVPQMLDNAQHPLWQDVGFRDELRSQLGESYAACVAAVTLVQQTLDRVIQKYGGLETLVHRSQVSLPHMSWHPTKMYVADSDQLIISLP